MTIGVITGCDDDGKAQLLAWYSCYNRARQYVLQRPDLVYQDRWTTVIVHEFMEGFNFEQPMSEATYKWDPEKEKYVSE